MFLDLHDMDDWDFAPPGETAHHARSSAPRSTDDPGLASMGAYL
jgi:hypothetical protein